jgi:phosphate uptake regulator
MKRSVIRQGHNTLTVTLPAKWAEDNSIKAGDELDVTEQDHSILVTKSGGLRYQKKVINLEVNALMKRELAALYKRGYDEIEMTSQDPAVFEKVQEMLHETILGFEIVKQTRNMCLIKAVAEVQTSEFAGILQRTLLILKSQSEGITAAMKNEDAASIASLQYMEKTNNRYCDFLRRVLNKQGIGDIKNEKLLYACVELLEKIADEYKYLCSYILENPTRIKKIPSEIIKFYDKETEILDGVVHLFNKYDSKLLQDLFEKRKAVVGQCLNLMNSAKNRDCILLHYNINVIQELADIMSLVMTMNQ